MEKSLEEISVDEQDIPSLYHFERMHADPDGLAKDIHAKARGSREFKRLRKSVGKEEAERILDSNIRYLLESQPVNRRAIAVSEMYNDLPEGEYARDVLNQRVYDMPGRFYPYVNNVAGEYKDSKGLARRLGGVVGDVVKVGWPVGVAGGAWWLANRTAKNYLAKPFLKRTLGGLIGGGSGPLITVPNMPSFMPGGSVLGAAKDLTNILGAKGSKYLIPGIGQVSLAKDLAWTGLKEGAARVWEMVATPLLYGIGAYALYRTAKYFIKKHKEKKMRQEHLEELERLRNDMLMQYRMFPHPITMAA
jgi:hypothetical protein